MVVLLGPAAASGSAKPKAAAGPRRTTTHLPRFQGCPREVRILAVTVSETKGQWIRPCRCWTRETPPKGFQLRGACRPPDPTPGNEAKKNRGEQKQEEHKDKGHRRRKEKHRQRKKTTPLLINVPISHVGSRRLLSQQATPGSGGSPLEQPVAMGRRAKTREKNRRPPGSANTICLPECVSLSLHVGRLRSEFPGGRSYRSL